MSALNTAALVPLQGSPSPTPMHLDRLLLQSAVGKVCRSYTSEPLEASDLMQRVEAAVWATAMAVTRTSAEHRYCVETGMRKFITGVTDGDEHA